MRIPAKIDYACRALIELCLQRPRTEPLRIPEISKRQGIPEQFLTQILINLKHLGYVESKRGKNGGYLLARAPREINLKDLILELGGLDLTSPENNQGEVETVFSSIWQQADESVIEHLAQYTFDRISERVRSQDKIMTFTI